MDEKRREAQEAEADITAGPYREERDQLDK